jgi:hypothetical protein
MLRTYVALSFGGFDDLLVNWVMGRNTSLLELMQRTIDFPVMDSLSRVRRIAEAIEGYPTTGYQLLSNLTFQKRAKLEMASGFLEEALDIFIEANPVNQYSHALEVGVTCGWSSAPLRYKVATGSILGVQLKDDYMTVGEGAFNLARETLLSEKHLLIDSESAWVDLTSSWPSAVEFVAGPNSTLQGEYVIPNWIEISKNWGSVEVTLDAYLALAYRPIPLLDGRRTILAGWHPAAILQLSC